MVAGSSPACPTIFENIAVSLGRGRNNSVLKYGFKNLHLWLYCFSSIITILSKQDNHASFYQSKRQSPSMGS